LSKPVSVVVDNNEILEYRWITPREALAEADAKSLILPRPTSVTIQDIAKHRNLAQLLQDITRRNIRVFPQDSEYYRPQEMGYRR